MKEPPRREFIPREAKVKQISTASGVREGTALRLARCLSLEFEFCVCGGGGAGGCRGRIWGSQLLNVEKYAVPLW